MLTDTGFQAVQKTLGVWRVMIHAISVIGAKGSAWGVIGIANLVRPSPSYISVADYTLGVERDMLGLRVASGEGEQILSVRTGRQDSINNAEALVAD